MKKLSLLLFGLLLIGVNASKAQYTDIFNFNGFDGQNPYAPLITSGNKLYGITQAGFGQVFSIDTNGTNDKDLFDFNMTDGYGLCPAPLTISNGVLYGTMTGGGTGDSGVIFRLDTNGMGFKDIFNFNGPNGAAMESPVTYGSGKLFGLSYFGGANHYGNIFSLDTSGNNFKDIFDFNGVNGEYPVCSLTLLGHKLYGMMGYKGTHDSGFVFCIDTNGNNFKDLFDFNGANGSGPGGGFVYANGVLYGQADGGLYHYGVIFSIDTAGNNYKDLHDFNGTDGEYPGGYLTLIKNKLFGITAYGGTNQDGVIFSVNTDGTNYKDLLNFNNTSIQGANPVGGLTLSGNKLYGLTNIGGSGNLGVIFSFDTANVSNSLNNLLVSPNSINIYPNPSTGIFTLQAKSGELSGKSIEVFNVLGEKVLKQILRSAQDDKVINLNNQPNGVYFYRIVGEDGGLIGTGKLIIQK